MEAIGQVVGWVLRAVYYWPDDRDLESTAGFGNTSLRYAYV
jgi:hypothetical protein